MRKQTDDANGYDLAIAGGGLAGGLIALALHRIRPGLKVVLTEAEPHFGGNHIWSYFESDIDRRHSWLVDPLISGQWPRYDVHFPKYSRSLENGYFSIKSKNLDRELRRRLPPAALRTDCRVEKVEPGALILSDGEAIHARAVVDVRGGGDMSALETGWQKFAGQMLKLRKPHGLENPVIMDATVEQVDGYRFIYCLPFSEREIFVEDTYYSDTPDLDVAACQDRIAEYAAEQGWEVDKILGAEQGQLPVIYGGDFEQFWQDNAGVDARAGTRAALIQPITSYSLPMAVQTAIKIAAMPDISQNILDILLRDLAKQHWENCRFYRLLCAFMFLGADPDKRYKTLEHTYGKDEELLARFYAGKSTRMDQINMLSGKPPIAISRALPLLRKYR